MRFFPWTPADVDRLTTYQFAGYMQAFDEREQQQAELWQALASLSST